LGRQLQESVFDVLGSGVQIDHASPRGVPLALALQLVVCKRGPKLTDLKFEVLHRAFLVFGAGLRFALSLACREPGIDSLGARAVRLG
jgi:hypothetical protein